MQRLSGLDASCCVWKRPLSPCMFARAWVTPLTGCVTRSDSRSRRGRGFGKSLPAVRRTLNLTSIVTCTASGCRRRAGGPNSRRSAATSRRCRRPPWEMGSSKGWTASGIALGRWPRCTMPAWTGCQRQPDVAVVHRRGRRARAGSGRRVGVLPGSVTGRMGDGRRVRHRRWQDCWQRPVSRPTVAAGQDLGSALAALWA